VIGERETPTVILPGWRARIDATGSIVAERGSGEGLAIKGERQAALAGQA